MYSIENPIALEAALKLKKISYIHAEGCAAGELKHGPIALIDQYVPVIVLSSNDSLQEKTLSNAALTKGTDVDQPKNLAKSVKVE